MKKSRPLTIYILIAMVLGILVGYACNQAFPDKHTASAIAGYISLVTDVFLRLIKMIIAPLVFQPWWLVLLIWVTQRQSAELD